MKPRDDIDVEVLRELLNFNPNTGIFTWKVTRSNKIPVGVIAGSLGKNRYTRIKINKVLYSAHRVAWCLSYGEWPKDQIDHINGIRSDNRLINLRLSTQIDNHRNQKMYTNNTSGVMGVYWCKAVNKWSARIRINYKVLYLGLFADLEDAKEARRKAEIQYAFDPYHGLDQSIRDVRL